MLVRDWMTQNVMALDVDSSVMDAAKMLREKNIRQFPVIDRDGKLVGIVSDRDVRDAMPSKFIPGKSSEKDHEGLQSLTASDIMSLDPVTVTPNMQISEAAELLVNYKIGGLPVMENGKLCGIITQQDVLSFLCSATAPKHVGTKFAFRLESRPGPLSDLLSFMNELGLVFANVFTINDRGYRNTYIQIEDIGERPIEEIIDALQEKYDMLFYINEGVTVDMR